jgi:hypothetical protein
LILRNMAVFMLCVLLSPLFSHLFKDHGLDTPSQPKGTMSSNHLPTFFSLLTSTDNDNM